MGRKYKIKKIQDTTLGLCPSPETQAHVSRLHALTFPADPFPAHVTATWIIFDDSGTPIGFSQIAKTGPRTAFLARAGVLHAHKGQNLHTRLIRTRLAWCRKNHISKVKTYVATESSASCVNLLRSGFIFYHPKKKWAGVEFIYLIKTL